jgi:hypothetical protein
MFPRGDRLRDVLVLHVGQGERVDDRHGHRIC